MDKLVSKRTSSYGGTSNDETDLIENGKDGKSGGISMAVAATLLVGQMAGAGVLNLPKAVAATGWSGLALIPVLCLLVGYSGSRLGVCWMLLEERWPEYQNAPCRRPYPHIAERALGSIGRYVTEVCLNITLFGVSTVYLLLAAQMANAVFATLIPQVTSCQWTLIFAVLLMPATWFGGPKDFWGVSLVAALTTVLMCIVVIVEVIKGHQGDPAPTYTTPTLKNFFLGFGAMLFTLGGASTFPTIQNDMTDKTKFPLSVVIAFGVLLLLYTPIAGVCYGFLGADVEDNVLLEVEGKMVTFTQVLMLLHFLFVFNIVINPIMQSMEDILHIPNKFGWRRCILRSSLLCIVLITGLSIPQFGKILDLIGGSTVTILTFLLPPLCYILLLKARMPDLPTYKSINKLEVVALIGIMMIGLVGGTVSTWSALSEVFSPGSLNSTCFSHEEFFG